MSVFLIRKEKPTKTPPKEEGTENEKLQQGAAGDDGETPETATDDELATLAKDPELNNSVILDGPLSRYYTAALNKAYANEDLFMMMPMTTTDLTKQPEPEDQTDYFFVTSPEEIQENYLDTFTQLNTALEHCRSVTLCVENARHGTPRAFEMMDYVRRRGGKVVYTQDGALEALKLSFESL